MRTSHARPSLRSLQVFESAARCGGFTAAGAELGITQSGVSRQVSDLEAILGVSLFVRNGARLRVTPAGQRLANQLAEAFSATWTAVSEAAQSDHVVTLSMLPSVAARWLAPRLERFMSAHPDIDLRITASRHLVDFAREGIDAAIRYCPAPPPNLDAIKLADETISPVCTLEYSRQHGLAHPDDLSRVTLLHGDLPENWDAWFREAGCTIQPQPGPRLGDDTAILQAVLNHQGVALGRSLLVADEIANSRLIMPFDVSLKASYGYWFVRPKDTQNEAVTAVQNWVNEVFGEAR